MIRLVDVHKHYRDDGHDNHVLRGVTLDVADGELLALMGASGSGKSTLLNLIGGLDQAYTGTVEVDGQPLKGLGDKALSRYRNRTVSFVFQQFHLLTHLPVVENVVMPSWFRPDRRGDLRPRAAELLGRVGLADKVEARPSHLSGGEKQRVAIARALYNEPKILLADEPTGALDSESGASVLELFRQLNASEGVTVVIVTHDPEVAARCGRVVRIKDGQIVSDGAPEAT